jgi:hypothetical protein
MVDVLNTPGLQSGTIFDWKIKILCADGLRLGVVVVDGSALLQQNYEKISAPLQHLGATVDGEMPGTMAAGLVGGTLALASVPSLPSAWISQRVQER